jgi:mycothiol synthase
VSDIHLRPVTRADAAALAEVMAAAEAVDRTEEHLNTADLLEEMDNPMIDLATDWTVAEVEGRVVGHSGLAPRAVVDRTVRVGIEGAVHPEHRRRGIGTALLDRMVARARAYAEERGARPVLVSSAPSDVPDVEIVLARHGMKPRRWQFVMTADLAHVGAPPELPPGYLLATWEGLDPEEIRLAHNRAFVDHPGWTPWSAEMWDQWVTSARSTRPALSLVARDEDGAIAAYVQSAEYDAVQEATGIREAFVGKVGTVPDHRRRGLADVLLRTALHHYRAAGYDRAALDVDSENPTGALGLYERAGFRTDRRWTNYASDGG